MARDELLDLIASTAAVLGKLSVFYERWQRKVARSGGAHHVLEFKAQRFSELQNAQRKQLEQLRSTPSQPN